MNTNQNKPGLFTAIAVMTLTSGIINLFWGFIASATALGTIIGIICLPIILPIAIAPTILGIFEIIYAAKLLSAQPEPVKPSQALAVFQILTLFLGNVFSMVVGILTLIFYNDVTVRQYFEQINGTVVMPPAPVQPAPVEEPELLPAPDEFVTPEPVEEPAKPKRVRKIAGK